MFVSSSNTADESIVAPPSPETSGTAIHVEGNKAPAYGCSACDEYDGVEWCRSGKGAVAVSFAEGFPFCVVVSAATGVAEGSVFERDGIRCCMVLGAMSLL